MKKRDMNEQKAYVDGYNACFEQYKKYLYQRGIGRESATKKMEALKEAVNNVLLDNDDEVGMCQQEVGTMSGKVTNGDMIKALFPDIELEHIEDIINVYCLCEHSVTFDTEWWNSPYRAESEDTE